MIWRSGDGDEPDRLAVDELGRLLAFRERAPLQECCDRNGWELIREGEGDLDLLVVRRWAERPDLDSASAGLLLEAWNFFEDLARSVRADPSLPAQGPVHDSAYEKIFGGRALDPAGGDEAWTVEETAAVRELLRAGLDLWERAVRGAAA
ncbi:hypothetical protein ACFVUH_23480 [Kitasatospora sp. NPDC058032]|uniref:hypothetical protein n=1 Tax=Kitasatospora sp. NPDC058032 TaxID=3346307 RepID=UPI0036DE7B86